MVQTHPKSTSSQWLREVRRFLRIDLHEARAPVLLAKLPGGLRRNMEDDR